MIIDPHLQHIFEKLNDDVITLSWKWQILNSLFGTQERVDLLSQTAPNFFQVCQTTSADDIFLTISRITDSRQSSGQDNLVITRLIEGVDKNKHGKFYQDFKKLLETAIDSCKPFKPHRHKRLAHNDLNVKLQTTTQLLPGISVADLNAAIKSLQDVMNTFNSYFFNRGTSFKVIESGGVKALVTYLQKGVDAFRSEEQQMLEAHGLTSRSSDKSVSGQAT